MFDLSLFSTTALSRAQDLFSNDITLFGSDRNVTDMRRESITTDHPLVGDEHERKAGRHMT